MPVRIIRRPRVQEPAPPVVVEAPEDPAPAKEITGASPHPRGWAVGDAIILRKRDFSDEQGKVKFLLHLVKSGVWYRVRGFDPDTRRLKLTSNVNFDFDSRVDTTLDANYLMAILPEGTMAPPAELIELVHRRGVALQTSAQAEPA
jgi:hypothetical protein